MAHRELSAEEITRTLKAIEDAVKNSDTSSTSYIGLVGAEHKHQGSHDIDVLWLPHKDAKIGESIIAMYDFFAQVDERLRQDHGYEIMTSAKMVTQVLRTYLAEEWLKKPTISIHAMFFPDYESLERIEPIGFSNSIQEISKTLHGRIQSFAEREPLPQAEVDPYFALEQFQLPMLAGKVSPDLAMTESRRVIRYVNKHYGTQARQAQRPEDIGRVTQELLYELDEQRA